MAGTWLDKIKDYVKGNPQQADSALDKVEDVIDKQTGGKYSEQIDKGSDALRDKLGLPDEQSAPAPEPEPAPRRNPSRPLRPSPSRPLRPSRSRPLRRNPSRPPRPSPSRPLARAGAGPCPGPRARPRT